MWWIPHMFENFNWIWIIPLINLLIWGGGLILLVVLIVKLINSDRRRINTRREAPLDILKRRYAAGEISREEYLRMKKELEE